MELPPIMVGDHSVKVTIKREPLENGKPYALTLFAECESEKREHRITFHPKHDKTIAEVRQDIDDAALLLARETVGHMKANAAISSLFDNAENGLLAK